MSFVLAYTTCDKSEAESLSRKLLDAKLIACAKQLPNTALYWWVGKVESGDEILLVLETIEDRLPQIEELFKKEHSYDTFILAAMPLTYVSEEAKKWWEEALR